MIGSILCNDCGKTWYAQYPDDVEKTILECPNCNTQNSYIIYEEKEV